MFTRLLFNPDPPAEGNGNPPAPAPPADQVTLSRQEYEALNAARASAAQQNQSIEQKVQALEQRYKKEALANKLNSALDRIAGQNQFHDANAKAAALRLLGPDVELRDDGTAIHLPTGKPVDQLTLDDASRAGITYLMKPVGGGTGKLGGNVPPSGPESRPGDYSSAIIENWNRLQREAASADLPALGFNRPPSK